MVKDTQDELIKAVKKVFTENMIDLFVGYENGTIPLRTTPCFITRSEEADRLIWNSFCSNNLAVYLPRLMANTKAQKSPRIGILCKGCDGRSVAGLIKEKQIVRENLVIIGVACPGMVDSKKILSKVDGGLIEAVEETDDTIAIRTDGKEQEFKKSDFLFACCQNCEHQMPTIYDIIVGEVKATAREASASVPLKAFSAKTRVERWNIFEEELGRCIRCYACRSACPNCYCKECFAEATKPAWLGVTTNLSDIMFFHMGRILHQAGRCTDCGACVRACPMDIDLRLFTRILVDEVKARFGYEPGLSLEEPPPLMTFMPDDKQEFMTEPE